MEQLVATVSRVLSAHRFRYSGERELQDGIEQVLRAADLPVQREAVLGDAGTIDFLVTGVTGGLGIEIKVKGSRVDVTRQVHGYLQCSSLAALLLVTTRAELARLPTEISGKRVFTHHLTSGAF